MRIDKFLKVSRIIKRRTVANEACEGGRVSIDGKTAKPSSGVKAGSIISIRFGEHLGRYEVLEVRETATRDQASGMYRVLDEDASVLSARSEE